MLGWVKRYKSDKMIRLWSDEEKYNLWRDIESAVVEGWEKVGVVPRGVSDKIKRVSISPDEVAEEEMKTRHEMTAFIRVLERKLPESIARFVHLGITSSDVMDTAFSIQLKRACKLLQEEVERVEDALFELAQRYKDFVAVGRTHGIHAEPTTLGMKFLSHYAEFRRVRRRLIQAESEISFGKISGAVGVYSTVPPEVEEHVLSKFGLKAEPVSTQVVPRDRYAFFILMLSLLAGAIERLALNLRIYQLTEIDEMREPFGEEQMGSSVMPHKKNPILSENLTGIARVIRTSVLSALENIALLMERDISHSSVERIIFPQVCILSDFALVRLRSLLEGIYINEKKIEENLRLSRGLILSSRALFELVVAGMDRESAYRLVQKASFDVVEGRSEDFISALTALVEKEDKKIAETISKKLKIVEPQYINALFDRTFSLPFEIEVRKKDEVFDPEGKAIGDRLRKLGYDVVDVRVGKTFRIKMKGKPDHILHDIFSNPVVDTLSFELVE